METNYESDPILGADDSFQIEKYWRMIKPRLHILAIIALLVTAAAYIKVATATPEYRAMGLLMIEPENKNVIQFERYPVFYGYRNEYFNTQIRILKSRSLQGQVLEEFYAAVGTNSALQGVAPEDIVVEGPVIEPQEATHLVEISYRSTHPAAAAELVNLLFVKFIEFKLDLNSQSSKLAAEFITRQIKNLQESLAVKEKEMHEYSNRKELFYVSREDNSVVKKFADLNNAYTQAQVERINKESQYQELKGMDYGSFPQVTKNPLVDNLKGTYSSLETDYKRKSQIFKPSYPEMVRIKSQMDTLQERIHKEIADIGEKTLQSARNEYQAALKREQSLLDLLDKQKKTMLSTNADSIYYKSIGIEVQNMRTLLNYLVRKQKESVVSSRLDGIQTSNIKIIDRAVVPKTPVDPGKTKILLLAFLAGLTLGFGVVYLLDYMDQTIKTPEESQALLRLPALGIIPSAGEKGGNPYYSPYYGYKRNNGEKKDPADQTDGKGGKDGKDGKDAAPSDIELINHLEPDSWFVEKYRAIRTSIMLAAPGAPPRIISVSSAFPSEGKTSTTLNLAVSFSQLGKRVLVIDGDLHRPRMHKIFKLKNHEGLSSYLAGRTPLKNVLRKTQVPNLFIITTGPLPPNPSELIDSDRMVTFLKGLMEKVDFVFIDTPPLLGLTDAIVFGKHSHSMILVTWAGKTHRSALQKVKQELDRFNINTMGLVLNRASFKRKGYGYNYGDYTYGYTYRKENDQDSDQENDQFNDQVNDQGNDQGNDRGNDREKGQSRLFDIPEV